MASPDFSTYIDFTEFDKQPGILYLDAVTYAQEALPEFNPTPGTIEDALLQAGAYIGAATMGAINRLPDGLMEGVLAMLGVSRDDATSSTVDVEFELFDAGDVVEGSTTYIYSFFDGVQTLEYPFVLLNGIVALAGETTVAGSLVSSVVGVIPAIAIGTQLTPASPSSTLFSVTTTSAVSSGSSAESDSEFLDRAVTYLQSLSRVLTTATQIENYILLTYASTVKRCKVYDLVQAAQFSASAENSTHSGTVATITTSAAFGAASEMVISEGPPIDGTTYRIITPQFYGVDGYTEALRSGTFTVSSDSLVVDGTTGTVTYDDGVSSEIDPGPLVDVVMMDTLLSTYVANNQIAGNFTIFVSGDDGAPIGRTQKTAIYTDVAGRIQAGLNFTVLDAWTYDIGVTITLSVLSGHVSSDVVSAVTEEIEEYISPNNWANFGTEMRLYDIVGRALSTPGVAYISSVVGSIPSYPDSHTGNQLLVSEVAPGGQITGYSSMYIGLLPRASVTVVAL